MIVLFVAVGIAAPAAATPVTVFFDGPSGFGVSAESANAAFASGVPFVYPDFVGSASGVLSVSQDLQDDSDSTATSIWTVENVFPKDLHGDTYLLFMTTTGFEIGGQVVEYVDAGVGLSIDPDLGWVLVRTSLDAEESYYYPAVWLGSLGAGATADPFAVNYVVEEPVQEVFTQSVTQRVLPQLVAGMGFAPIPEPTAVVLMGLGLAFLAVVHRLRS